MKAILAAVFLLTCACTARAGEAILPYSAFGPQAAAHELIGMEWWQWNSNGDSRPREHPIKVVVFWNQTRDDTAKRHPVDRKKLQDFRYVEYSKAIEHMERTIKEFKLARLEASAIKRGLAQLKQQKAEQGSPGQQATLSKSK